MRTLSIRQPWAWLVVNGHKPVENREWHTDVTGPLLIHAGKTMPLSHYREAAAWVLERTGIEVPEFEDLDRGGIVGAAVLTGCVSAHASPFFTGPFGLVLASARPLPFHEWKGRLGWFDVPLAELSAAACEALGDVWPGPPR